MPAWLHRTTKQYLTSVSPASLTEPESNYIQEPDLLAVAGFPSQYWIITGDLVSLEDQAARDAIDVAALVSQRDAIADEIDRVESYSRAFALVILDEFNALRVNAGLSTRTVAQLKTAVRNKLDT